MEDRTPTPGQEGRVFITPEDGSAPFYATVTMADNPTTPGTPLNKETLLQDSTEIEIFGNASNRTVDEAFSGIMDRIDLIMQNVASMALTITDTAGNPIPGVYVNGVFDDNGNAVKTNASGQINGYVSEGNNTISISGYADVEDYTELFNAVKGQTYTKTIQVTTRNYLKITSSRNVKFSENVNFIDYSVVAGGGAGGGGNADGSSSYAESGAGGGGGQCVNMENVTIQPNTVYQAIVGAGGIASTARGESGGNGGISSFMETSAVGGFGGQGARASGQATGGSGNGQGGHGAAYPNFSGGNGAPGNTSGFSSFTDTTVYGGGGGGGTF